MTLTKLLTEQIAIIFAIVMAGVWAATQMVVADLGYQTRSEPSWFGLVGWPIYSTPSY